MSFPRPRWLPLFLGISVVLAPACGGGGSDPVAPAATAQFTPSGTAAAPNGVRLVLASSNADTATLNVMVGGPTTSSDLYSFAFDIVLGDPTVATYVTGSARIGDALQATGSQTRSLLVSQSAGRIVVGVSKLGGGPGNAVQDPEEILLSLTLRVLERDITTLTLAGSTADPGNPTNAPVALDSAGAVIGSVRFDPDPATLAGL
jgi:hypothetical protein